MKENEMSEFKKGDRVRRLKSCEWSKCESPNHREGWEGTVEEAVEGTKGDYLTFTGTRGGGAARFYTLATDEPATDTERESIARILDASDPEGGIIPDEGHESWEWYLPQADALIAAGYHRQRPITEHNATFDGAHRCSICFRAITTKFNPVMDRASWVHVEAA